MLLTGYFVRNGLLGIGSAPDYPCIPVSRRRKENAEVQPWSTPRSTSATKTILDLPVVSTTPQVSPALSPKSGSPSAPFSQGPLRTPDSQDDWKPYSHTGSHPRFRNQISSFGTAPLPYLSHLSTSVVYLRNPMCLDIRMT